MRMLIQFDKNGENLGFTFDDVYDAFGWANSNAKCSTELYEESIPKRICIVNQRNKVVRSKEVWNWEGLIEELDYASGDDDTFAEEEALKERNAFYRGLL